MSAEPEIGPNGLPLVPRPGPEGQSPQSVRLRGQSPQSQRLGPALSSMGLGFVAMLFGPLFGVPAIVQGVRGRIGAKPGSAARTHATTGIVLGTIGSAWWVVALVAIL